MSETSDYERECFLRYLDALTQFKAAEITLESARRKFQVAQDEYLRVQAERRLGRPLAARRMMRGVYPYAGPGTVELWPEDRPWPGFCQSCKASLDPPDRKDCPTCHAID